jgi:hypothetical protein
LFDRYINLEFLGLEELSLYSCSYKESTDILMELLIISNCRKTLKNLKLHFQYTNEKFGGLDDLLNDLSELMKIIGTCKKL